jgi:hypothetical protein
MAWRRRKRPPGELPEPEPEPRRPWDGEARNVGREVPPEPPPGPDELPDIPEVAVNDDEPGDEVPALTTYQTDQVRRILVEKAKRQIESLRLYEPLPEQHRFHSSRAPERILRGSNRGGKTLPAAVEVARALTGQDTHGKYPLTDGRCFAIGKDGKHVSQVMYPKLFKARPFKIIRDLETGKWRSFRPLGDCGRESECKPAPPLIPPRFVKEIAWENKREGQPSVVRLHNGWEVSFFSSLGKPPQGSDLDLVWMDEEIVDPEWYPEMSARLLDRLGRFVWSATPQAGTEQLYALHERADDERGAGKPRVTEHVILLADNPHITDDAKKALSEKLNEQERVVRIGGEFLIFSFRVYPEYSPVVHEVKWFEIPKHWTRYVAIDPGRQVCAALFLAIPPKEEDLGRYLYDELYIRDCNAMEFGRQMKMKAHGQRFQTFIIDRQGSRVTEMASGRNIEVQYSEALKHFGVSSVATGHNFAWSSEDVDAGVEAFRAWLLSGDNGKPVLRVLADRCENWKWEIKHYRYKRIKGIVLNKPEDRGRVHSMACSRYLAMYEPRWVKPTSKVGQPAGAVGVFREKQKKRKEKSRGEGVTLGPRAR